MDALALTLSGGGDLFGEASDHSAGGVVLVQGMGKLLAGGLQLLPQGETVQHYGILGHRLKADYHLVTLFIHMKIAKASQCLCKRCNMGCTCKHVQRMLHVLHS